MWYYGVVNERNSRRRAAFTGLCAGMILTWLMAVPALAVDSGVDVTVCGDNVPAAQISITEPVSDSIVDQATSTFRGAVANATQIEVAMDGNYSQTLAIGSNDTSFETNIVLPEGTHTISMTALGICGSQSATDSIILTYQPAAEPSGGDSTPTEVGGDPVDNGIVVGKDGVIDAKEVPQSLTQVPVIGPVIGAIGGLAQAVGLEKTVAAPNAIAGISRVIITVVALTSVVMASSLAPLAAQSVPGLSETFNVTSHRSMLYLGWIIRGVGVLAFALAYFL